MRDLHVKVLALCLTAIGAAICAYKVIFLGLPLQPREETPVWTVQARITFQGTGGPAKVGFAIPDVTPNFVSLDEDFISSKYGLAVEKENKQRKAQWAVRRAKGEQTLYYRISLVETQNGQPPLDNTVPRFPAQPEYPEPYDSAINAILDDVRSESADVASYARELLIQLNQETPSENVELLRDRANTPKQWVTEIQEVLKGARIPSRVLQTLHLTDRSSHAEIEYWLQVHNGQRWLTYDPFTGTPGLPSGYLVWQIGTAPLLQTEGARSADVEFSIARVSRQVVDVAKARAERLDAQLMNFTPYSLPVQTQNVYRILLTVPLGALLVVFFRSLIGIKTFGTFMPVLIALAFRETQLIWGILLFSMIVAIGLLIRFYLEKLMLLLVPRLASVVVIVVLLMLIISLVSNLMGAERTLSVALFPMVILAMTIERMSIVWEESGAQQALLQGLGSLAIAVVGYLVMTHPLMTYLVFAFPELLLVVLAACLLMGRYTGYRLTELRRFRYAVKNREPT